MDWCYATASVVGLSHVRSGTRLQDSTQSFVCSGSSGNLLFIVVADGAGSAEFGGQGASVICRTLTTLAREELCRSGELPDDELLWSWVDEARDRIHMAAEKRGKASRDFAATLALIIASKDELITAHVGDGAIVARNDVEETWSVLSAPQHGEYASTTYFLTDDPNPKLRIHRHKNTFNAFAVFSDGIENLVLDHLSGEPSAGFFDPVMRPLRASKAIGKDAGLSKSLAAFLGSERLNERTDDDKTLVIAVSK